MISLDVTYTDFNGETQNERCFFHLSVSELTELQVSREQGYDDYLKELIAEGKTSVIFVEMKRLFAKSYGVKSEDGKQFIKTQELTDAFMNSPAFDSLLVKMMRDADYAAEFVRGIIPSIEQIFPDMSPEERDALMAKAEEEVQKSLPVADTE